jgi:UPF0755 protein
MKRSFLLKIFLFGLCASLFLLILYVGWSFFVPPRGDPSAKVILIKKGSHLRQVAQLLQEKGVIRSKHFFILIATLLGKKASIKAGEYEFSDFERPLEVLDTLVKGQVRRHLVTIPEGYTLAQVAQLLEDLNIVGKDEFLQKATSPVFIASLGLDRAAGLTLEGYLFPETYHFIKEMDPQETIQMMVQQFKKVFGPELAERASQLGMSEKEVVILASIIEKETPLPDEKPLVSAVFHNRLSRRIPLQSDPTVIYGIKNFDGNLTKEHLLRPTPYNTYLIPGLPPTPICNPGKESILAALHPASVPYLYFVSKNDGSHFFSSEIEEHNRAVSRYQKTGRKISLDKKMNSH